jgi:deoxycytidylate deaminase
MPHSPCKRMSVYAIGIDVHGNIMTARNGNTGTCTGAEGRCGCQHAEHRLLEKMPNPMAVSVSHAPCIACAKRLVEAGVRTVTFLKPYRLTAGIEYLDQQGVLVFSALGE